MIWHLSHRADSEVRPMADRHYSRQTPGSPQFVPPGRCLVLKQPGAYWVTSWPFGEYVRHAWPGAFVCSAFRNEGAGGKSSDLIREALAITRWKWPDVPPEGLITFIDASKVRPKRDPGYCFLMAGGELAGKTKGGLVAIQFLPDAIPDARLPGGVLF